MSDIYNNPIGHWVVVAVAMTLLLFVVLTATAYTVWFERVALGRIQRRPGPNRVGSFGLMQLAADGVKLAFKESFAPRGVDGVIEVLQATNVDIATPPSLPPRQRRGGASMILQWPCQSTGAPALCDVYAIGGYSARFLSRCQNLHRTAKKEGDGLVQSCGHTVFIFFNDIVAIISCLTVNKFHQNFSLVNGKIGKRISKLIFQFFFS